ncbi:plasmid fertility inhibition factor family protein [Paraburkholderia strydomiana]
MVTMVLKFAITANRVRAVVEVDRAIFFKLWQAEPNSMYRTRTQATGMEATWRSDYKFHHEEKDFSFGESNPVPLADVDKRWP